MARPLRIEFPGAIYHVTSRMVGSWRERGDRLFRDERDYQRFVDRLEERVQEAGVRLYLFCLMRNHFHLLLETPEGNLSRFMQNLTTAYTVYYNRRHDRHGHVLDGRFKAKLVSGDEYLLRLSRYVHQNPVWISGWAKRPLPERIAHLRTYPWSSYPSYIGRSRSLPFVDYGPILKMTDQNAKGSRSGYRRYVELGLAQTDQEFEVVLRASACCIGDEGFRLRVERWRGQRISRHRKREDVSFRRVIEPLKTQAVLCVLGDVFGVKTQAFSERRRNSHLRAVAASRLIRFAGQTQRAAAEQLGLSTGAAVSAQLKCLPSMLRGDKSLKRKVDRVDERLEQLRRRKSSL